MRAAPAYALRRIRRGIAATPTHLLLLALYALVILAGAAALKLPMVANVPLTWSDTIFTSASAVTVTGLAVVNTATDLNVFGQVIVAILIQFGGIGLMTFAVLILSALGLPIGLAQQMVLRDDLGQTSLAHLIGLARVILRIVVIAEVLGTLLLATVFVPDYGWRQGLWHAFFHAVASFNNAGISTFPDGLVGYATEPMVNLAVPLLIIIGGIGYVVLDEIFRCRSWRRLSLHSKLMLSGTPVLIVISVGLFALLEWSNGATLGAHQSMLDRLMISWFQGITTRSGGFNTTDIGGMTDSASLLFIALMLIGGGSTSTAGGIKVTTFLVMLLATVAFFQRRTQLSIFGRSIGLHEVLKVMALTAISLVTVFTGMFLMTLFHRGAFLDVAFEAASAFGTVGLSRGLTGQLNEFERAVVIALMVIGRLGPLTLGFFMATQFAPKVRYPAGQIYLA